MSRITMAISGITREITIIDPSGPKEEPTSGFYHVIDVPNEIRGTLKTRVFQHPVDLGWEVQSDL